MLTQPPSHPLPGEGEAALLSYRVEALRPHMNLTFCVCFLRPNIYNYHIMTRERERDGEREMEIEAGVVGEGGVLPQSREGNERLL